MRPPSRLRHCFLSSLPDGRCKVLRARVTDPAAADAANAAVLEEYRFTDLASATYTRDDGRTLKIRAARFADASGAFGAYTFYLQPKWRRRDTAIRAHR